MMMLKLQIDLSKGLDHELDHSAQFDSWAEAAEEI